MKIQAMMINAKCDEFTNKKYKDRNEYMREVFFPLMKRYGVNIEIFYAIHPRDIDIKLNTVEYAGKKLKRGVNQNDNTISLALGHMELYKKCIEKNINTLIFEDDVMILEKNIENTLKAISSYCNDEELQSSPSMLYLLSTCPYRRPNMPKKEYKRRFLRIPSVLKNHNDMLFRVNNNWNDTSGTAAYMVNPICSKNLIQFVEEECLPPSDANLHQALNAGKINMYVPKDYQNNFELHPTLS